MINKILSTVAIVGVLSLTGYEWWQAIELQKRFSSFVNKGPRFTAQDGQELCERVKELEMVSYGYRDAGKKPLDCRYLGK